MRKTALTGFFSVAVTALIGLAPAAHALTWVDVGSPPTTGAHKFFATTGSTGVDLAFNSQGTGSVMAMACDQIQAEGYVNGGNPPVFATIEPINRLNTPEPFDGMKWEGCIGPVGLPFTVEVETPWQINPVAGYTPGTNDLIASYLSGSGGGDLEIRFYVAGSPGVCGFTVKGSADSAFEEATQELTLNETGFTGNLYVDSVAGSGTSTCFGLVGVGDPMDIVTEFVIGDDDPANSAWNIASFLPVYIS